MPAGPAGGAASTAQVDPNGYFSLSAPAVPVALGLGDTLYSSGGEAIAWDQANGQSDAGIDPNGYYALSPQAASALSQSGEAVYSTGAEANAFTNEYG